MRDLEGWVAGLTSPATGEQVTAVTEGKAEQLKPSSSIWMDVLRVAGVSLLFCCALELGLRLGGAKFEASLYEIDPVRHFSFRPGAKGWHTTESDIYIRINKQGRRDLTRTLVPSPGTLRIAVLGSSTTAGLEVEQPQTYTALLEKELGQPGRPVEVLNFGTEGFGAGQDYYTLRDQVWKYHPQIVMDEVSLKQYVLNCTKKYCRTHDPYPYFVLTPDGGIAPDPESMRIPRPTEAQVRRSNLERNIVNSLQLTLLATDVQKQATTKIKSLLSGKGSKTELAQDPMDDPMRWTLVPPPNPTIEQGWGVLQALELAMRDDAKAHGAEYWVIASDDQFQVDPKPEVAETLRQAMHASNLEYGDERFDSFLTAHDVHHIHLEPALKEYVRTTGAYLHGGVKTPAGEGHWNVLGHRVVAGIIAARLRQNSEAFKHWEEAGRTGSPQAVRQPSGKTI